MKEKEGNLEISGEELTLLFDYGMLNDKGVRLLVSAHESRIEVHSIFEVMREVKLQVGK